MIIDKSLALLLVSVGLMIISPFLAILSHRVSKYLLDMYVADEVLIITYMEQGQPVAQVTIKTKSDGAVAKKIIDLRKPINE
ncbi:hypothetical protein ALP50_03597 [Pseudomonas syringae pv. spinaceae]|uniref:Uncharacterized protein n=1 Tax=Pseudomonas syringae pv. spinaceae TaxID=264459 RepID=A0A0Q0AR68_PSESX|nr:hypothetical protein [Pseudomonas syringae]KPY66143.1 Unknown protein sequence [Pseudomonas syringae pv. spinaceae]RMT32963.1 hypothetical protein ALP50_03597 [Pseudomonas syringae pv. spinaceae]